MNRGGKISWYSATQKILLHSEWDYTETMRPEEMRYKLTVSSTTQTKTLIRKLIFVRDNLMNN
jgi:hypothetical protein